MGGFMGFGQTATEKSGENKLSNLFNYGLGAGQGGQTAGSSALGQARDYFSSLLSAGRTQTAQNAAPAVQAALAQSDATKRQEATMGTSRGGGTASAAREATTTANKQVDDIINKNLVEGKATGAAGMASTGATQLQNALGLLGLSGSAARSLFETGTQKGTSLANSWISALI
jgi:hypothetical protein